MAVYAALLGADLHEAAGCLGEINTAAAEEPLLQEVLSAGLGDAESVAALLQGVQEPSAEATRLKKDLRSMQKQLGAVEVPPEDARLREMALAGARLASISPAADAAAALFFRGWALVRAEQQASAREALRLGRCLARMGKAKEELLRQLEKELAALPASAGLSGRLIVEPEEAGDAVDCAREVAVAQAAPGQAWRLLPCPARFSWIIYGPPSALLAASCSPEEEHRAALEALGLKNSVAADGEAVHVTVEAVAASLKAGEGCHVHGAAGAAVACFLCKYGFGFPEDFNPLLPAHSAEEAIDLVKGLQGELGEEGEAAVFFFEKALWGEIMMGSVQKQSKKAAKKEPDAVQPLGGKVVRQPGDGNCLFHSMAYVLGGEKAAPLRKKVCEFMLEHPAFEISGTSITDWLQMSAQCSVAEYCKRMQRAGEWGGAPEIAVCARMKGVNIHVYQPAGAAFELVAPFNGGEDGEPCSKTVSVVYVGQMHYDALLL